MEKIFKWLTSYSNIPESKSYLMWFVKSLSYTDFKGIELVMYCYLKFCAELGISPKRENLVSYIKTDLERDVKKNNIRLDTMNSYDYDQVSQFKEAVKVLGEMAISTFEVYLEQNLEGREFETDMNEYFNACQSELVQDAFMNYYPKLSDGSNPMDISEEFRFKLATIEKTYDKKKLKEIRDLVQVNNYSDDEDEEFEYICSTHIPAIDGDSDGIYTHLMTTLNAQPGGGKTRMALCYYAYPMMTEAKKDVLFYETELKKGQVLNILIAFHITKIYGGKIKIPDSIMNKKRLMTEEQLQIYKAAKYDLFKSGKYGKFIYKGKPIVEELEADIKNELNVHKDIGLVAIDYMGLIRSVPLSRYDKVKEQYEIITDAYEIMRDILMYYPVHGLCINQYNDKGIDAAESGKPIRSGMTQGGHIVFRHTDYDLNLTCTPEQKLAGVRMLGTGKTRGSAGFQNVMLKTDMSVSIFNQT